MALPEFLGIGAMKAASTLLYALLHQHPGVFLPDDDLKEVRFFNRYYDRGVDWYAGLFQPKPGQVPGEVTPDYLYRREAPARIAEVVPRVKMIAILRDPVARTYSQYTHYVQESGYRGTFRQYLGEHDNAIGRSLYHEQIQRYLQFFPREQMMFLLFEEFTKSPVSAMPKVFEFIGIDPAFVPSLGGDRKVNATMPRDVARLAVLGRKAAKALTMLGLAPLALALKKSGLKEYLVKLRSGKETFAPMTPDDRRFLVERVQGDMADLERFLGRDLKGLWTLGEKGLSAKPTRMDD
jgi:hypothetical protein